MSSLKVLSPGLKFRISGFASAFPEKKFSNEDVLSQHPHYQEAGLKTRQLLARRLQEEYRYENRYFVKFPGDPIPEEEKLLNSESLAHAAFDKLLQKRGSSELDSLVFGSTSPTRYAGSHACSIMGKKELVGAAYDIKAGCSTSLAAFQMALSLLRFQYRNVAVVCSETLSRVVDPSSMIDYFGLADGAAALCFEEAPGDSSDSLCFTAEKSFFSSDGRFVDAYTTQGEMPPTVESIEKGDFYLRGNGELMHENALRRYSQMIQTLAALESGSLEVDYFIPHQVNWALTQKVMQSNPLKVRKELVWHSDQIGNIGGASISYSLGKLLEANCLKKGDRILMMSVGGGLTFAFQLWTVS